MGIPAIFNGDLNKYNRIHYWVRAKLGRPNRCEECGVSGPKESNHFYQWSNISRKYLKELSDWRRLCKYCHIRQDSYGGKGIAGVRELGRPCINGHILTEENIYIHPVCGTVMCRKCKRSQDRESLRRFRARQKQLTTKDSNNE